MESNYHSEEEKHLGSVGKKMKFMQNIYPHHRDHCKNHDQNKILLLLIIIIIIIINKSSTSSSSIYSHYYDEKNQHPHHCDQYIIILVFTGLK